MENGQSRWSTLRVRARVWAVGRALGALLWLQGVDPAEHHYALVRTECNDDYRW